MRNILVISPHPDDESIGCGGTICKHVGEGDNVEVIFLTSGEKGGHGKPEIETVDLREREANDAAAILKFTNIEFWREPDGKFVANDATIEKLKKKISEVPPQIVYVTHQNEAHPDHREAAILVSKSINDLQMQSDVKVWMYEVWTPLQKLDCIVDISPFVDLKRKAIQAHKCQCNVLKFDESALSLNRYRGEMHSWPGGDYAEVFQEMEFK